MATDPMTLDDELVAAQAEHEDKQRERDALVQARWGIEERIRVYMAVGAEQVSGPGGSYPGLRSGDPVGLGLAQSLRDNAREFDRAEEAVTDARRRVNRAVRAIDAQKGAIRWADKAPGIEADTRKREAAKVATARKAKERRATIAAELIPAPGSRLAGLGSRLAGRS